MPDILALPLELWAWCVTLAIDGQEAGPLELLGVSRRWDRVLLDTPSLWNQIYVKNGEDEIARISTFLHFSRGCSLHVNIVTALPTMDGLKLIASHISRVSTISIRPAASDTLTSLLMERWKQVAACILATLCDGLIPSDVKHASCFGISLRGNDRPYYCIVLMQFKIAKTADKQNRIASVELPAPLSSQIWEEEIKRAALVSADRDIQARTVSIHSLVELASYAQHDDAITIAIPSCVKLLEDDNSSVQLATIDALHKFAVHDKLRETLGPVIPLFIKLLEHEKSVFRSAAASLLEYLADKGEPREGLGLTIPSLITLLERQHTSVFPAVASLFGNLAKHEEFHEAMGLATPLLIKLLECQSTDIVPATLSLFGKLAEHEDFLETLGLATPLLTKLLGNWTLSIQSAAVFILGKLSKRDELREAIGLAILSLIQLIEHGYLGAPSDAISNLGKLAEHDEFHEAMGLATPSLIKLLENQNTGVLLATISLFGKLAEYEEHRGAIAAAVPYRSYRDIYIQQTGWADAIISAVDDSSKEYLKYKGLT